MANVGDSRGVICDRDNKAVPLSFDHKPQQVSGRNRRVDRVLGCGLLTFLPGWNQDAVVHCKAIMIQTVEM